MKTRYAIAHIDRSGNRKLTLSTKAIDLHDTREAATAAWQEYVSSKTADELTESFGKQALGTFEVWPVKCYNDGGAVGSYFNAPGAPTHKDDERRVPHDSLD